MGTILAAAGTALPESVVTLVAVLLRQPASTARTSASAPRWAARSCVGTIAYGVTGVMLSGAVRAAALAAAASRVAHGCQPPPAAPR